MRRLNTPVARSACALGLLLAAMPARAQAPVAVADAPAAAESPTQRAEPGADLPTAVTLFLWNTSPVALRTGMVLGGGAALRHRTGPSGLFLAARLAFGETTEATREWELTHVHGALTLGAGIERRFGAGLLRAELGLGAMGIRQLGERQQFERLTAAGLQDLRRDAWSFGPLVAAEVGAAVVFLEPWTAFVQLGPAFTAQRVSGTSKSTWLITSGLGVGRAF